jgi:hypothetical protein
MILLTYGMSISAKFIKVLEVIMLKRRQLLVGGRIITCSFAI